MLKILTLLFPLLIFPPLFFLNILTSSGFDLTYPRYYSFYPFPLEVCKPDCGTEILGLIGSVIYWIVAYIIYFKLVRKSKYPIESAIAYTVILSLITLFVIFGSSLYIKFFIPKETIPLNFPSNY
ncbi:hypothetical protein HYT02_02335 [Candidatus Gottesmanbacteria bacterium]|nr:hypothetical protein [Candidatus Gottesmanbacteria bacterium]